MSCYSLDRFEGEFAVLLDDEGNTRKLPAKCLGLIDPPVKEGEVVVETDAGWQRDEAETARRRKKNAALLANLRRRPR